MLDLLSVSLEHVDRVDGRVSEVPQPEGGVPGWGDYQTLGGVCAAVGQLLVMPWRDSSTRWGAYTLPRIPSCLSFFLKTAILTMRNVFQPSYTAPSPLYELHLFQFHRETFIRLNTAQFKTDCSTFNDAQSLPISWFLFIRQTDTNSTVWHVTSVGKCKHIHHRGNQKLLETLNVIV